MKAGLTWPRGRVHMSNKSNPVFQECCFFTGFFFCNTGQYSVVLWSEAKEHSLILLVLTVSNILHFWKGCSMSIILHILCRNSDFSKRCTSPWKGGLDIWKCTLQSFKGHGATFQGIPHILFGYCPRKNTLHCPKGRLLLFRRVCLFWILHLLAGMGML